MCFLEITKIKKIQTVGMHCKTSLANNKTKKLWTTFMPRRNEITNKLNENFLSIQVYPPNLTMADFTTNTVYETYAAVEVDKFSDIPGGMQPFTIPEGLYAVFEHKGTSADFEKTANFIYGEWFSTSGFILDKRPHFEIMDKRYLGPDHPDSIENVYIPITSITQKRT